MVTLKGVTSAATFLRSFTFDSRPFLPDPEVQWTQHRWGRLEAWDANGGCAKSGQSIKATGLGAEGFLHKDTGIINDFIPPGDINSTGTHNWGPSEE